MSTLPSLLLVASLSVTPPPGTDTADKAHHRLPATCIADLGPEPVEPPGHLQPLLPTLTIGFGTRPRRRHTARYQTPYSTDDSLVDTSGDYRHRDRHRTTTRWSVQLQWNSPLSTRRTTRIATGKPALSPYCRALLEVENDPPNDLDEAVDRWIEISRNRALLEATRGSGGSK